MEGKKKGRKARNVEKVPSRSEGRKECEGWSRKVKDEKGRKEKREKGRKHR